MIDWEKKWSRVQMTEMCYPDKITVRKFEEEISQNIHRFVHNMEKYPEFNQPKFAEEWMERFQAWIEMEIE